MDAFDAVASRNSCRAFLPTPIPEQTVRDIVERAARAPSAGDYRIFPDPIGEPFRTIPAVQAAFTGARLKTRIMPVFRRLSAVLLLMAIGLPALAAEVPPHRGTCLSKAEQRAAVAAHRAIPLAQAMKSLRAHGHRAEVVRARLCRRGDDLVYVLTLLARSGKVTRTSVDAANGELINSR